MISGVEITNTENIKLKGVGEQKTLNGKTVEVVPIKGFYVAYSLPSQRLLESSIPEYYKDTEVGKIVAKIIRGYFYNRLVYLRTKFLNILKKYAINVGFGYILPADRVDKFMKEVEELIKEYEEYEEDLRLFIEEGKISDRVTESIEKRNAKVDIDYFNTVLEYLKKKYPDFKVKTPNIVDRVIIRLIPFYMDVGLIEEYMGEEVKRTVESRIYEVSNQILEEIRKDIKKKLEKIIERLEIYAEMEYKRENVERLRASIDNIERELESIGIPPHRINELNDFKNKFDEILNNKKKITKNDIMVLRSSIL